MTTGTITIDQITALVLALSGLVGAVAAVIAALYGRSNSAKINTNATAVADVHALVNGQSEQLLSLTDSSARAEGRLQGYNDLATAPSTDPTPPKGVTP
jgi:hypothetical protein